MTDSKLTRRHNLRAIDAFTACFLLLFTVLAGCGRGLTSSESSDLYNHSQLQVYVLARQGTAPFGSRFISSGVGVLKKDQKQVADDVSASLHETLTSDHEELSEFNPKYAVAAGVLEISFDFDAGLAEIRDRKNARLVRATDEVKSTLDKLLSSAKL